MLKFLNWMKSLFRNVDVESEQGAFVRKFQKEIDHLYDAFYNTLASASETIQWVGANAEAKIKKLHSVRDNSNGKVYNEKNTTKEGLIRGEPRQETREAFLRRAVQTVLQVETRGKTGYGYRRTSPADVAERSGQAEEELKELGVPSVVYDILEVNQGGVTSVVTSEATTIRGDAVYINNALTRNPKEVAGHEAYHFWKSSYEQSVYSGVLEDNIIFSSNEFESFINEIADGYSLDDAEIGSKQWGKLMEEVYAYISGFIHSGNNVDLVKPFIRNFSEVESAWNALVNSKSKNGKIDSQETESSNDEGIKKSTRIREFDHSEETITNNTKILAKMSSVHDVPASALKDSGKPIKEIYENFFTAWGGELFSEELGTIDVKTSSIRSERSHGSTAEKIAAIEAIPTVVSNGKVIFTGEKNNGRILRIVVAAPIKMAGKPYYMGVMVQRDNQHQRLYLHDVVIEEETPTSSLDILSTTGSNEENERLFVTSILQRALKVKRDSQETKHLLYQRRGASMTNRSILTSALESATQHESEAKRLAEYKAKIDFCFFPWGSPWRS